jgi:hypothetical protein
MINNQRNTKVVTALTLTAKSAIVTAVAFINPWFVIPTLIALELLSNTIENSVNKTYPIADSDRGTAPSTNFDKSKESRNPPRKNFRKKDPHTNVNNKRNSKFSKTTQQARSSKIGGKRNDQT